MVASSHAKHRRSARSPDLVELRHYCREVVLGWDQTDLTCSLAAIWGLRRTTILDSIDGSEDTLLIRGLFA